MIILGLIFLLLLAAYVYTAMKARANVSRMEERAQEWKKVHKDDENFPR